MEFRVASASRGLAWFQGAVRMLDRNPRGLLAAALLLVLIEQVPNFLGRIPDVAVALSVVLLLLIPTLIAGMFHAIAEADADRPVLPMQLFEGFRRRGARGQLLLLGVFVLLALLLVAVAFQRIFGPENLAIALQLAQQKIAPDSPEVQRMAGPFMSTLLVVMAIVFVLTSGLFFAIPRVMFDGRKALSAFAESIAACAVNVLSLSLVVYMLVFFAAIVGVLVALSLVAAVLGLLGSFGGLLLAVVSIAVTVVMTLVSTSGNYLAWREVFGHAMPGDRSSPAGIVV
jgi:hypothetical protein